MGVCSRSVAVVVNCMAWLFPELADMLKDSDATSCTPMSVIVTWSNKWYFELFAKFKNENKKSESENDEREKKSGDGALTI